MFCCCVVINKTTNITLPRPMLVHNITTSPFLLLLTNCSCAVGYSTMCVWVIDGELLLGVLYSQILVLIIGRIPSSRCIQSHACQPASQGTTRSVFSSGGRHFATLYFATATFRHSHFATVYILPLHALPLHFLPLHQYLSIQGVIST